jgi:hypothetical protein
MGLASTTPKRKSHCKACGGKRGRMTMAKIKLSEDDLEDIFDYLWKYIRTENENKWFNGNGIMTARLDGMISLAQTKLGLDPVAADRLYEKLYGKKQGNGEVLNEKHFRGPINFGSGGPICGCRKIK